MTKKIIPNRKDIPIEHQWDLTPLFESDDRWEILYTKAEQEILSYPSFKGRMQESVIVFKNAIEFHLSISRKIEKLYTYAHLKNDQDKSNPFYLACFQKAVNLHTRGAELSSFIIPEIQALSEDTIGQFMSDETLRDYRFYLEKILRYRPHTLNETAERILALSREATRASSEAFGQLNNVDISFGSIVDASGNEIELSHGNFTTFLMNPNREIRKKAFHQYYRAYDDHKHTLAATLLYATKKDNFYAKARNFKTCREAALFPDNIPETVYDNLIDTVKHHLDPLFRYLRFRKQALALDELHHYDTYVPIISDVEFQMPYEEAVAVIEKALFPLGNSYTEILKAGLTGGWVDRYENKGKRSGAYSSGCYDSPPYILLNYEDRNINSLYTLIHEAGHSMHSYFSIQHQPYVDYEYTIFVAEVASTFNEALLTRYLLGYYENNPQMQVYILNREIDNIRATLIRQTMFAEFEKICHNMVEDNQPLTLEQFTDQYRRLLDIYFADTLVIDPELALECLRIPHFYFSFYVYKYATGVSAAIALADKVITGKSNARDDYLNFLKLGGSKFPIDQLIEAGIDMRSPEPVKQAMAHLGTLVDRLIEVYGKL